MDFTVGGATGSLTVSNTLVSMGELDLQSPNQFDADSVDAIAAVQRSRSPANSINSEVRGI